jgi:cardiolipin synthase (CMP-forming)
MTSAETTRPLPNRFLTVPNVLTLIRFAMIPVFVLASLGGAYTAAFFIFVGAAITDGFDGWYARKFNQTSRLGALLDPAADKTLMVSAYVVFTMNIAPHRLPPWLTFTVFLRDIVIVLFAYLLYTRIRIRRFPPNIPGKVSTIIQIVALSATVGANTFLAPLVIPLLWPLHRLALVMTLISGGLYLRKWDMNLDRMSGAGERVAGSEQ